MRPTPMTSAADEFEMNQGGLRLAARQVPWDAAVFGYPVAQIHTLVLTDPMAAMSAYQRFQRWLDAAGVRIVSCRLAHERLPESMFLEANGFRFIEMVLHPLFTELRVLDLPADDLAIAPAAETDIPALQAIALDAFQHERFHVDPRLAATLGDLRYARWVGNSWNHPQQVLLKITDGERLVGMFIVEYSDSGDVYWHLTAIAPRFQGQGYGLRVWRAMLRRHQTDGHERVTTTISVRNVAVLNLYAKLGFRFAPPEMTFHWVREPQ